MPGAVMSWPDVPPAVPSMCIRATDHDAFNQEQQNEAGNDDTAPFKTLQFWVDRRNDWLFFGAIDPSLGKQNKKRDPSAILVGGLNRSAMVLDVVEADICRRVPDLIISRAIDLQAEYQCLASGALKPCSFRSSAPRTAQAGRADGHCLPGHSDAGERGKGIADHLAAAPHVNNGEDSHPPFPGF